MQKEPKARGSATTASTSTSTSSVTPHGHAPSTKQQQCIDGLARELRQEQGKLEEVHRRIKPGEIPVLVATSGTAMAIGALAAISRDNPANEDIIAKMLVQLLHSKDPGTCTRLRLPSHDSHARMPPIK